MNLSILDPQIMTPKFDKGFPSSEFAGNLLQATLEDDQPEQPNTVKCQSNQFNYNIPYSMLLKDEETAPVNTKKRSRKQYNKQAKKL